MEQEIISKLKQLQNIKPDPGYAGVSRSMLMALMQMPKPRRTWFLLRQPQAQPRITLAAVLRYALPATIAASFMFLMLGGYSTMRTAYFAFNFPGLMNEKILAAELNDFEIQIKIAELQYHADSSKTVSLALNEAGYYANNLSNDLIKNEGDFLNAKNPTNEKIDEALNDLIL